MAWAKGQSGNPKGRLSEKPFTDALRFQLAKAGDNQHAVRKIAQIVIDKALEGDEWAIDRIWDRLDGKVAQQVDATIDARVSNISSEEMDARMRELAVKFGLLKDVTPRPASVPQIIDEEVDA